MGRKKSREGRGGNCTSEEYIVDDHGQCESGHEADHDPDLMTGAGAGMERA